MRVVSGALRGRRIDAPPGTSTRPTTDKVREATFNALGSLDLVLDARVADLYAGSGALGIEALSRGAAHCTFVERDRTALAVLRGNLHELDLIERSTVVPGDALVRAAEIDADLVFADPPYDTGADIELWSSLLAAVRAPFVVAESGRSLDGVAGWDIVREKRYGRTWVTFFERA
ncbi:MAG: 16S rRNA (guanine(966)-N(2))-methyltransferase RsmD [Ilumatobacter sp.]|nr:MAG: 16S rRNA (guanine(966)-N(2))-methyltransferase RsmD [Ilumatobacter sp.]